MWLLASSSALNPVSVVVEAESKHTDSSDELNSAAWTGVSSTVGYESEIVTNL